MFHLAIESSGIHGSVSLFQHSINLRSLKLATDRSSVQDLAVVVKEILSPQQIPAFISVTHGPGSFTGLRVGLTTAKMLAFAWNIPIVAVDTLHVLASQIVHRHENSTEIIAVPTINAFRQQVFTSVWRFGSAGPIVPLIESTVVDASEWQSNVLHCLDDTRQIEVRSSGSIISVGGPGLKTYQPNLASQWNSNVTIEPELEPHSDFVGRIGLEGFLAGRVLSAEQVDANYVRASAAEEKLKR